MAEELLKKSCPNDVWSKAGGIVPRNAVRKPTYSPSSERVEIDLAPAAADQQIENFVRNHGLLRLISGEHLFQQQNAKRLHRYIEPNADEFASDMLQANLGLVPNMTRAMAESPPVLGGICR